MPFALLVPPHLDDVARLLSDPSRLRMLWALGDSRAYTATELARVANLSAPVASNQPISPLVGYEEQNNSFHSQVSGSNGPYPARRGRSRRRDALISGPGWDGIRSVRLTAHMTASVRGHAQRGRRDGSMSALTLSVRSSVG